MSEPQHAGHFARLRERYARTGLEGFADYEALELLLSFALPRRDTKPIAKRLIQRFGSIGAVLNAPPQELAALDGMGERSALFMGLIRDIGAYTMRETITERHAITHSADVQEYLRMEFGQRTEEFIAALYLDNRNNIILSEIVAHGTVNQCALYPRELFARAFRHGAASLIIAHNHPGGSLEPSEADWRITKRLREAGKLLEIGLVDHLIISRTAVASLREMPRWTALS